MIKIVRERVSPWFIFASCYLTINMSPRLKAAWEKEMNVEFSDVWWGEAIKRVSTTTSCAQLGLIQFKVLHRLHYSKAKLAKIYLNVNILCDRCSHTPADLSHMFYFCPKLQTFWGTFFLKTLSGVLNLDLHLCPLIAIFGVPVDKPNIHPIQSNPIRCYCFLLPHGTKEDFTVLEII